MTSPTGLRRLSGCKDNRGARGAQGKYMQSGKVLCAMDQPATGWFARLRSPFIVAGWVIPDPENPLKEIVVKVNGQVRATTTTGLRRQDVADAYPDREARWRGFVTEA